MTELEIIDGITKVCKTSVEIHTYYDNKDALLAKLNVVPKDELDKTASYYASRSGVIIDLRKEVLNFLSNGNKLDLATLEGLIIKHRTGKDNKYRAYKNYYSIFFPFITFYGHDSLRQFIKGFISEIIDRLDISGAVKHIYFDFQGARQQGSDTLWLAIYNNKQHTQSTGLQFFVEFRKGKVNYGLYRHSDQSYLDGPISVLPENYSFEEMIQLFNKNKNLIIEDEPKKEELLTISLKDKRLYKISHGSFKTKANENIRDVLKENQWIVIYENTGKGQAEAFKNELTEGDYVYITIGGDKLLSIAKVKEGPWGYVPEDITDPGWIYREVKYIKPAVNSDPTLLKAYKGYIYPSGNSTLTEVTIDKIEEANKRIFVPHFGVKFISEIKLLGQVPKYPNNIILYGPPGTGKTYNTIDKSVEIITGIKRNHEENKIDFDKLKKEGQIEFVTFH
ncbi:MAG: hypothetical protein JWQ14_3296, partial [Adhaeribacter sp.]|nr:hypothetical protein [Adhaeribacter sp.]